MTNIDPESMTPQYHGQVQQDTLSNPNQGLVNDYNVARRLNLIKQTAPIFGATPDGVRSAMQMAQSSWDDQTLVTNVKTAAAQTITEGIKSQINAQQDGLQKWKLWSSLDQTQKTLLQRSGFTPPEQFDDPGDTSVLGVTKGIFGGLVKDITQNPITKPVFGAIGKGLDQVQHLAQAGILGVQEEGFFGLGGSLPQAEIDRRHQLGNVASDLANLWDRTGNGEKVFNVKAMDRVHQAIPDLDKYNFVQSLAAGEPIEDYLTRTLKVDKTDPTFTDQYLKYSGYATDKGIQDAVTDLKNNKVSPGRFLAGAVLPRGSTAFNIASGGIDATFDIVGDPFLWTTEGLKDYRIAKTGLGAADGKLLAKDGFLATRVDQLRNMPKFDRAAEAIASGFREDNLTQTMDQIPAFRKGMNSMAKYLNVNNIAFEDVTKEHVFNYFKSEGAIANLQAGEWSVPHYPGLTLPSISRIQELKSGVAMATRAGISNFSLADYGLDSLSPEQLSQVFPGRVLGVGPKWSTMAQAQNGVGEFLKGLMTKVPHQDHMNPMDEKAPQIFRAMMDYVLPRDMQESYLSDFLKGQTVDARRAAYTSAVDAMWHYSGAYGTDAGKDLYRKITQADQVFASDGRDLLNGAPAGILPSDAATSWAIPTFRDMLQATKDTTSVRRYLDETNDGVISKFMNHWRPAVLLRAGFVPRAYGEEMLSFLSREGIGSYVKSRAALSATTDKDWLLNRPVRWVADSMLDHIPVVGDHVAALTHHMANYADQYFKNFAERIAPENYLNAARANIQRGAMDSVARELGSIQGAADESLPERFRKEQLNVKDANGDIRVENVKFGPIETHMRGDAFYHHTVYREMRRLAEDPLAQPLIDGMRRQIDPERGDQLVQLMKDQGFLPELEPHVPMIDMGPRINGLDKEAYINANARMPKDLSPNAYDMGANHPLADGTRHPNIQVLHDAESSTYQYHDPETGQLVGHLDIQHGQLSRELGLPAEEQKLDLQVHPDYQGKGIDHALMETADHELGGSLPDYAGYDKTGYAKGQEFDQNAVPEHVPGEPIPRTDLNYGHALIRARQWVPEQVMPKFEQYLKNPAQVSSKAVVQELAENGMDTGHAESLIDVLDLMTPRERTAVFTQDGHLERMLQAKMTDPNAMFDMSAVPGYTSDRYYHGTFSIPEDGKLKPIHHEWGNLYGPGFYTTENPEVATQYTDKYEPGVESRQGVFQMGWQGNKSPNLVNLDAPLSDVPEGVQNLITKHFGEEALDPQFTEAEDDPYLREIIEGLSTSVHQGPRAKAFIDDMQKAGYDGWTHIGGGRMGGGELEHKVSIFFDTNRLGVLRAPKDIHVPSFLPSVRSAIEQQARREYEENLLSMWSAGGGPWDFGPRIARDRLVQGDMSQYGQVMRRGQEVENDVVAQRPAQGSRRVYTVLGDPNIAAQPGQTLKFAPLGSVFDHEEGWVPIASSHAYGPNTDVVEHAGETNQAGNMAWYTTDHNEAQYMQQKLLNYKPGSNLRVGYTDVPEDVFKKGQSAARSEGAAGINPLAKASQSNQVWLPNTWRSNYQALSDEGVLLEPPVQPGKVRLYRSTGVEDSKPGQYDSYHPQRTTAEARVPFTDDLHYIDVPHQEAMERMAGQGEAQTALFKPEEHRALPLKEDVSAGVDQNQAFREWGHTATTRVHQVFGGDVGGWNEQLADVVHKAVEGDLTVEDLWDLTPKQLPEQSIGPQIMLADKQPFTRRLYRSGFDAITQAGDALIRSPMYLHNYAKVNEAVREMVERQLGSPEANQTLNEIAGHLGANKNAMIHAWYSLPEDIRGAANPLEAAIARDPIPANLRLLQNHEDLQRVGNAAEALLQHKDNNLIQELTDEIVKKKQGIQGALPSIVPDEAGQLPSVDDLVQSYLGMGDKMRANVLRNGLPEVFPKELIPKTPIVAGDAIKTVEQQYKGPLTKDTLESMNLKTDPNSPPAYAGDILNHTLGGFALENGLPIRALDPLGEGSIPLKEFQETKDFILNLQVPEDTSDLTRHNFEELRKAWRDTEPISSPVPTDTSTTNATLTAEQWDQLRGAIDTNKHIEDTIHQISRDRAVTDTIPWIHDHHLRSQFQEHAKNFIPFWFAQENFISRVGNLVARDPAVLRKVQLGLHGMQTFGAIEKNQFGEDVFNIPATGALMRVLQKGANVFGNYSIPLVDPMSGEVKYALPGIDELTNIAPSFSPVVSLPLEGLTRMFPELEGTYKFVAGERGAGKSVVEQLVPSWAYNTYRGLAHNPGSDHAMVSTAIQTAQRMEAAGLGISEKDASSMDTPSKVFQEYIDRLQNHTRLATLVKGLVGFISPVSPDINPNDNGLSQDFQNLLKTMPLDDALTAYMQQHPDGLPYTVMKTKVTSGAPLPSSPEALKVMDDNPEFFKNYPNAGAWFLPQSQSGDDFSQQAYNQQMAMNLRVNKSLTDWYKDYYFASASKDYFDTENGYNARYAAAKNDPQLRQQMKDQYDTWKQDYFNQHPVFAEEIQSPEGKQRRARVIAEMTKAVNDPNAPDVLHKGAMADMVDTYNGMQNRLGNYNRGTNSDQQIRQGIKDQFHSWATVYVADNPSISAFYQRVIQPEVGI